MIKILMIPNKNPGDYHLTLLERALKEAGVKVVFYSNEKSPFFSIPIFKEVLRSKIRIIHIHWIQSLAGFKTKYKLKALIKSILFLIDFNLAKFLFHLRIIWTIHNLYSHELFHPKLEKFVRKHFAKKVDAIIVHCNQAKAEVQKEFAITETKIHVLPQGNYTSFYNNSISKQQARQTLKLDMEDFVFLHFGRIRPYKGVNNLLRAFQKLNFSDNIKLMIIGKPLNDMIKNNLLEISKKSKNIIFKFEYIPDHKIQIYMNAADILVMPYREVLSSGELLVSMGFGKPIIAPKMGCIIDKLNINGAFLYRRNDSNGLRKTLEQAIENKDKLVNMGKYNFNYALNLYWDGEKTKNLYKKFLH